MAITPYIEAGLVLQDHLSKELGLEIFAEDAKPRFTEEEQQFVDKYVDRLNAQHKKEIERAGPMQIGPELASEIQRTIVAFALKQYANSINEQRNYRPHVSSLIKSWLFDSDPMTWMEIGRIFRAEDYRLGKAALLRSLRNKDFDRRARQAIGIPSLFADHMEKTPDSEMKLNATAAALVEIYVQEFKPRTGIFGSRNLGELKVHLRLARSVGILR
jgi:hypothetical protein